MKTIKFISLAGSLPSGVDSGFYSDVLEKSKNYDVKILADCSGESLKKVIKSKPWCIKPNIDEFAELFDCDLSTLSALSTDEKIVEKALELNKQGVEIVIVTLGGDGLICTTNNQKFKVEPPTVEVLGTVGAGDSFVAGFLHMYGKSMEIEKSLIYGSAVATAKVTKKGTEAPSMDEINKILKQIKITTLN